MKVPFYALFAILFIFSACSGRTGEENTGPNNPEGNPTGTAGAYTIKSSSCGFAAVGGDLNITTNNASSSSGSGSLSADTVPSSGSVDVEIAAPTATGEGNQETVSEGSAGDGAPSVSLNKAEMASVNQTSIAADGGISLSLTYSGKVYSCTGKLVNNVMTFTCSSGSDKCLISANQNSANSASTSGQPVQDSASSASTAVPVEAVQNSAASPSTAVPAEAEITTPIPVEAAQ